MIISGRGGIVLYRKVLTKTLHQPRLIAGLVTALCEFSIGSLGQPAAHIELDKATITVVELPVDPLDKGREYLRAVLFHDTDDTDYYGHVLGLQLLKVFKHEYGERLLSMQLANLQGVEEIFRGFSARVRPAIVASVQPLMQSCKLINGLRPLNELSSCCSYALHVLTACSMGCALFAEKVETNAAVRHAFLVRHHAEGAFSKSLDNMWYSSANMVGSAMIADLQALLSAGDDVLASNADESSVVTVGETIRIERLDMATLVVVSQPPHTFNECLEVIASCTRVLKQCKYLQSPFLICPGACAFTGDYVVNGLTIWELGCTRFLTIDIDLRFLSVPGNARTGGFTWNALTCYHRRTTNLKQTSRVNQLAVVSFLILSLDTHITTTATSMTSAQVTPKFHVHPFWMRLSKAVSDMAR